MDELNRWQVVLSGSIEMKRNAAREVSSFEIISPATKSKSRRASNKTSK